MWFRAFLMSWFLLFTALLVWMATHTSASPTILGRYSNSYFLVLLGLSVGMILSLAAQTRQAYTFLYKKKEMILLLFSSIMMSIIFAEVGIRVLDPLGVSYFEATSQYQMDKIPDDSLIYKHQSGLRKVYQKVEVRTNEIGLRERSIQEKHHGELRLLLLGDSITFGWGVRVEDTFSRKLEAILRKKVQPKVTTINSGVGSYNTWQEYHFLKDYFDILEPDMVSLLYNSNDIQMVSPPFDPWSKRSLRQKSPPEVINILLRKSWLCRLFIYYPLALAAYSKDTETDFVHAQSVGRKQSMEYLKKMAIFCQERDIPFVTFYYQGIGGMTKLDQSLLTEMTNIGKEFHFHVFKVQSYYNESEIPDVINSRIDPHPNEQGHQILADTMANLMLEHELLPRSTMLSGEKIM